jgi:hypothetical protein
MDIRHYWTGELGPYRMIVDLCALFILGKLVILGIKIGFRIFLGILAISLLVLYIKFPHQFDDVITFFFDPLEN